MVRLSLFLKNALLMLGLLVLILSAYFLIQAVNEQRIVEGLQAMNKARLQFLQTQIENNFNEISLTSITLARDPVVLTFQKDYLETPSFGYKEYLVRANILSRLTFEQVSGGWTQSLAVYSPSLADTISLDAQSITDVMLTNMLPYRWEFEAEKPGVSASFTWYSADLLQPFLQDRTANIVVRAQVPVGNLQTLMQQFIGDGQGDVFLFHPLWGKIGLVGGTDWPSRYPNLGQTEQQVVGEGAQQKLVTVLPIKALGWQLIGVEPTSVLLSPLLMTRNLFYIVLVLLVLSGLGYTYLLYRQIQLPLTHLMDGFTKVQAGDFTVRIAPEKVGEFDYIITGFNTMTHQIENLIEKVLKAEILAQEAYSKQLQSQINPHFLYNCLAFIMNMCKMNQVNEAIEMASSLAKYYRYTTANKSLVLLKDELAFLNTYLSIQQLRNPNLRYLQEIPDTLLDFEIPAFSLQPLVENAILHGVDRSQEEGLLRITGRIEGATAVLTVADNGPGLEPDELEALSAQIQSPEAPRSGIGLWNIHQRFNRRYGAEFGVFLYPVGEPLAGERGFQIELRLPGSRQV